VNLVNDPPVIAALPELSFNEDDSLLYTFAELYVYVTDPDTPDSLLMVSSSSGKYITVRKEADMFVFKAGSNWFGRDTLEIVVADGELADTAALYISVHAINDAPVFVDLPDTVKFDNEENEVMLLGDYIADADLPGDSLRWQFSASNDTLQLQFNAAALELTLSAPNFTGIINLRFTVTDDSGATAVDSVVISVIAGPSGILPDLALIPRQHELYQNYPNPFNPLTRIRFGLPSAGRVRLEIYNILGQRVGLLLDEFKQAGYHVVEFNAAQLGSGIYFYRLQTDKYNKVMKMVLLK
jgi:Secretion system C-terminal sorting domain/Bacterial Ig domain